MTAAGLLADLRRLGVTLTATGGRLRVAAPAGVVGDDLRAELARNKAELIRALTPDAEAADVAGRNIRLIRECDAAAQRPAAWADAADLPANIIELACRRPGWSPAAWRARLLQLAARCAPVQPARAAELRAAALAMTENAEKRQAQRHAGCAEWAAKLISVEPTIAG